jgi:sporulation protein YlmC with PRC-barrel domain
METGARIVGEGGADSAGPGPHIMAASTLDSERVLSSDGDEVGKIKEIMLDVKAGRIAYAVMASGGFLGIGEKLLAIPWSALALDTDRKCFLLEVSSARVKEAPGFDKEHWPSMADPSWATTLHEFYGADPYWDDADDLGAHLTDLSGGLGDDPGEDARVRRENAGFEPPPAPPKNA